MSDYLLQIDLSNLDNKIENDLIKIRFGDEDVIQVNFSKLVNKSNYIRDKYKYSEALDLLQAEIEEIETNYNINEKSVKLFIQLIQEEKINIPVEHYKNFYTLSEYFQIPQFTSILDNISRKDLYKDLNFTIQILLDSETAKDSLETKLTCKIENFLKERINECIKNSKFKELPLPTIFRILDQGKENVDQNLLVDFICESANTRSILLKFVEIDKLEDKKVEEFIKFIDEQDEDSKKSILQSCHLIFHLLRI